MCWQVEKRASEKVKITFDWNKIKSKKVFIAHE
jgi:hypothetical protein